jgi:hypothetical protein
MPSGATVDEVFETLYAQAQKLWGEAYAEHKRAAIRQTAEEIVIVNNYAIPPDLEPQFFG